MQCDWIPTLAVLTDGSFHENVVKCEMESCIITVRNSVFLQSCFPFVALTIVVPSAHCKVWSPLLPHKFLKQSCRLRSKWAWPYYLWHFRMQDTFSLSVYSLYLSCNEPCWSSPNLLGYICSFFSTNNGNTDVSKSIRNSKVLQFCRHHPVLLSRGSHFPVFMSGIPFLTIIPSSLHTAYCLSFVRTDM